MTGKAAMEPGNVRFMEHLAIATPLALADFCSLAARALGLPGFAFDAENETEWGVAVQDGIEYNVSRPFDPGTLQEWDASVPADATIGFTLVVTNACPESADPGWAQAELLPRVARQLAQTLGHAVFHHRTWLGPGRHVLRTRAFMMDGTEQTETGIRT